MPDSASLSIFLLGVRLSDQAHAAFHHALRRKNVTGEVFISSAPVSDNTIRVIWQLGDLRHSITATPAEFATPTTAVELAEQLIGKLASAST